MQHIIENEERIGAFTSSNAYKLMDVPEAGKKWSPLALTYIEEKKLERKMGRALNIDFSTHDTSWGNFMEFVVFPKLADFDIQHVSNKTLVHPKFPFWAGSPDFIAPMRKVAELKCYQPKNFAKFTDSILTGNPMEIKYSHPQVYWQLVSNSILTGVTVGEAMSFMPYRSELALIRQMVEDYEGDDQHRYKWIYDSEDYLLPYLADGSEYQNLNTLEFDIPRPDAEALNDRMIEASVLLLNPEPLGVADNMAKRSYRHKHYKKAS